MTSPPPPPPTPNMDNAVGGLDLFEFLLMLATFGVLMLILWGSLSVKRRGKQ